MFNGLVAYLDSIKARDPAPRSRWEILLYPGLLADDADQKRAAAESFGAQLFILSGGDAVGGKRGGLIWGAGVEDGEREARDLLDQAKRIAPPSRSVFSRNRSLLMLDRWAAAIAHNDGERHLRAEGVLLLRIGLFGR